MRILGIDPGYAIVGWGVVNFERGRFSPVAFGAITTEAGTPFEQRLLQIYTEVKTCIERYRPEALSIEKLYFQNNHTTAIEVAEARGVILLAAAEAGLRYAEYTPLQVKSAVTGYGQAKKPQVMEMTRRLLRLEEVPRPDDTADALAMAICYAQSAGSTTRQRLIQHNKKEC